MNICRLCANHTKIENLTRIESTSEEICNKLHKCCRLSISMDDSMPKAVCPTCLAKLNECYKFFIKVQKAQCTLKLMLSENVTKHNQYIETEKAKTITEKCKNVLQTLDIGQRNGKRRSCDTVNFDDNSYSQESSFEMSNLENDEHFIKKKKIPEDGKEDQNFPIDESMAIKNLNAVFALRSRQIDVDIVNNERTLTISALSQEEGNENEHVTQNSHDDLSSTELVCQNVDEPSTINQALELQEADLSSTELVGQNMDETSTVDQTVKLLEAHRDSASINDLCKNNEDDDDDYVLDIYKILCEANDTSQEKIAEIPDDSENNEINQQLTSIAERERYIAVRQDLFTFKNSTLGNSSESIDDDVMEYHDLCTSVSVREREDDDDIEFVTTEKENHLKLLKIENRTQSPNHEIKVEQSYVFDTDTGQMNIKRENSISPINSPHRENLWQNFFSHEELNRCVTPNTQLESEETVMEYHSFEPYDYQNTIKQENYPITNEPEEFQSTTDCSDIQLKRFLVSQNKVQTKSESSGKYYQHEGQTDVTPIETVRIDNENGTFLITEINTNTQQIQKWESYTFLCCACNYTSTGFSDLLSHGFTVHTISNKNELQYKCYDCHKIIRNYHEFICHVRTKHHPALTLRCDGCDILYKDPIEYEIHRYINCAAADILPNNSDCPHCGKNFTSTRWKELHIKQFLRPQSYITFKCLACLEVYRSRCALNTHEKTHQMQAPTPERDQCALGHKKSHTCKICKMNFSNHQSYEKHHVRYHYGRNNFFRFSCEFTSETERYDSFLPLPCLYKFCDERFIYDGDLKRHIALHGTGLITQ